jgi:hypothetical protein
LFGTRLEDGAQLGEGQPLFPKIEEKAKK